MIVEPHGLTAEKVDDIIKTIQPRPAEKARCSFVLRCKLLDLSCSSHTVLAPASIETPVSNRPKESNLLGR